MDKLLEKCILSELTKENLNDAIIDKLGTENYFHREKPGPYGSADEFCQILKEQNRLSHFIKSLLVKKSHSVRGVWVAQWVKHLTVGLRLRL